MVQIFKYFLEFREIARIVVKWPGNNVNGHIINWVIYEKLTFILDNPPPSGRLQKKYFLVIPYKYDYISNIVALPCQKPGNQRLFNLKT